MMKKLNRKAERIFRQLIDGMDYGDNRKIDNSEGTFMAVHVEIIGKLHKSLIVSIAHYFEQNGDLCQDPEMTFLVNSEGVFPMTFQQAIPPVYQEAVRLDSEGVRFNARLQSGLCSFAGQWMSNIGEQQSL